MQFRARRAALLLIDLQRAFCSTDGSVARQGRDVTPCLAAARRAFTLLPVARAAGLPVVWTRMCYRADYADGGLLVHELRPALKALGALRDGSPDAELLPEAEVRPEDHVIAKQRYSAFHGTLLESILRARDVDTLLVAGVTTSMCVESTVRDAAQRDYRCFVLGDACGDFAVARHAASLEAMTFGFAVLLETAQAAGALRAA